MELELECIAIEKDEGTSAILGHAGFIKTVEDLYEAMVGSVPGIKFGIAFAEASGPRLVRSDGNDDGLRQQAEGNILKIAAGHTFLILFKEAYPINVINNVRNSVRWLRFIAPPATPYKLSWQRQRLDAQSSALSMVSHRVQ